jgi:hypothetical protein
MHLVIHAGTHKTASTFLQHVLILNQQLLAGEGIYTQADAMMTGNHGTAWVTLLEDYRHVEAHVREAIRQGRRTALLSSEDFETLIFDSRRARLVEQAALSAGATSIEWTFCLRDPGDYFVSIMAQLSKLVFVDYLGAFATTLRDGRFRAVRERKRYPLYWDFCFDYETHLAAFAKAVEGTLTVHDFRNAAPFPGHGIIGALGVDPSQLALPGDKSRNARLSPPEAEANRIERLQQILAPAELDEATIEAFSDYLRVPPELEARARDAIHRQFAAGMERLLANKVVARNG